MAVEPSNKIGVQASELHFIFRTIINVRSGHSSLHSLEEIENIIHSGTPFLPFSPFFEQVNELIGRMVSSGLFKHWASIYFEFKESKNKIEDIGAQVLTMDQMEVAFLASLLPLTLALTAFLMEVFAHWVKIFIPRVRAYIVLKNYYRYLRTF